MPPMKHRGLSRDSVIPFALTMIIVLAGCVAMLAGLVVILGGC